MTVGLRSPLVVSILAGCGGSGADKAGGGSDGDPVVLTLVSEDKPALTAAPEFADAVERLSGGTLRIELVQAGGGDEIDAERGVVEDVRAGKTELGLMGPRVGPARRDWASRRSSRRSSSRISSPFGAPAPPGTLVGRDYEMRWSRYRDSLTFARVPGREPLLALTIEPFTRVR